MLGSFGVGSIIAALFIARLRRRYGIEGVLSGGTILFAAALSWLAWADAVPLALPATLLAGMAWVTTLTSINVAMQMRSPDEILGRCLSIYQAVTFGAMAVGSWAWGLASDLRDLPFALHGAAIFLLVSLLFSRLFVPMPRPDEGGVDA